MDEPYDSELRTLFEQAAGLPPGELTAFLAGASDAADRIRRVRALLDIDRRRPAGAEAPWCDGRNLLETVWRAPSTVPHPDSIGGFRLIRRIAEGGMGVVFEAEQTMPHRRVALKLLHPGASDCALIDRLRHEACALARVEHPAVARIYEFGTTDLGCDSLAYIAMELVSGVTLDKHARSLSIRERIALLAQIADGVHEIHLCGVVHSDLKPANILIDRRGLPRIVDFGVARLSNRAGRATSGHLVGPGAGTLSYMSPDQCGLAEREIDARSDIYTLGVIAYEVLTGRALREFHGISLGEAVDCICHDAPPRLGSADRRLRGDLEIVVTRAMAIKRTDRYQSASALADEFRRVLRHEPVLAAPASTIKRVRQLVRRHLVATTLTAALLIALVTAGIGVAYGLLASAHHRALTSQRNMNAASLSRALGRSMYASTELEQFAILQRSGDFTLSSEAVAAILGEFDEDPADFVRLAMFFAKWHKQEGNSKGADRLYKNALRVANEAFGPHAIETLAASAKVASWEYRRGHLRDAISVAGVALGPAFEGVGEPSPDRRFLDRLRATRALALLELGCREEAGVEADRLLRGWTDTCMKPYQALECYRAVDLLLALERVTEAEELLAGMQAVIDTDWRHDKLEAFVLHRQSVASRIRSETTAANALLRASIDVSRNNGNTGQLGNLVALAAGNLAAEHEYREIVLHFESLGEGKTEVCADALVRLGGSLWLRGAYEDAEKCFRRSVGVLCELGEESGARYAAAIQSLAVCLRDQGRFAEAERLLRESVGLRRQLYGSASARYADALVTLARVLELSGQPSEALALVEEGLRIRRNKLGSQHPDTAEAQMILGLILSSEGAESEAETLLRSAITISARGSQSADWRLAESETALAIAFVRFGRRAEAEALFERSLSMLAAARGENNPWVRRAQASRAEGRAERL